MSKVFIASSIIHFSLAATFVLSSASGVFAGISTPPVIIIGSLQTNGGLEVSSGQLQFEFIPSDGGSTIRVDAVVGSFLNKFNFYAFVPAETSPLETGSRSLELDGGTTYTPRVLYEGEEIGDTQIDTPYTPSQGDVIAPLSYTVSPTGAAFSVSSDLTFGFLHVGAFLDKEFQINSVGTEPVAGTARLDKDIEFKIRESDVAVSEVAFNLNPGESLTVAIRFAPTVQNNLLTDTFRVETAAENVTRLVSGDSKQGGRPGTGDLDEDGDVDYLDLLIFLRNWGQRMPPLPNHLADINKDGAATAPDLYLLVEDLKE